MSMAGRACWLSRNVSTQEFGAQPATREQQATSFRSALVLLASIAACQPAQEFVQHKHEALAQDSGTGPLAKDHAPDASVGPTIYISEPQISNAERARRAFARDYRKAHAIVVGSVLSANDIVGNYPNGDSEPMTRLEIAVENVVVEGGPSLVGSVVNANITSDRHALFVGDRGLVALKSIPNDDAWFVVRSTRLHTSQVPLGLESRIADALAQP